MTFQIPTDTYFYKQWHLLNNGQTGGRKGVDLNVLPVWEYYRGAGINVGVYDNGTYVLHEDLFGNWNNDLQPIIDGVRFDPNPLLNQYREPVPDAHGTAVAGLIVAPINGIGVVGVAPEAKFGAATVLLGKVGREKEGATKYVDNLRIESFKHFSKFDVVNHSWGGMLFSEPLPTKEKQIWIDSIELGRGGLGVLQVVSAGNGRGVGSFTTDWTAYNMRQNIIVAAGSDLGDIINYSTPGPTVLVTAPVDVNKILGPQYPQWERKVTTPPRILDKSTTTDIPGKENGFSGTGVKLLEEGFSEGGEILKASLPPDYSYTTYMNGTSASAPMVSGVVSLMLDANPLLGYRDVQEILAISSRSPWQVGEYELLPWQTNGANYYNGGGFRYSHDYGFGFVDAAAAVRLSESWKQQRTSANEKTLQGQTSPIVLAVDIPADISIKNRLSYNWNISSDITIEWVELQADITHSWWGDLDMTLTSPSGTKHTLLNRIGVSPGFVGPLNPDTNSVNLLGLKGTGLINQAFASTVSRGESSIGQWKLEINGRSEDQGGSGGTGVLKSLQLSLFGSEKPGSSYENTPTYYYTDRYAELLKLEPKRLNKLEGDFGKNAALNFAASSEKVIVDLSDTQAQLADLFIPIANSSEIHTVFGGGAGDKLTAARQGSSLYGGWGDDQLFGSMGSDFLSGGKGNDLIHGGIGADVITGGAGRDELHGDFGWNTYRSEKDGVSDLIAIKSDQFLVNWLYGQAGNSPNGEKSDIIEGLDLIDKIRIIGIDTSEISFAADVATKGVTGIGIYGKGILEALYTGGDLTLAQIQSMTSGDASAAAMSNSVNAYGTW
jgi:subtilisin family serine protease